MSIMNANRANSSNPTQPTLVVFCRRPALGIGKQRIARELGAPAGLALAKHLLDTALEDAGAWQGPVVVSPADPGDTEWAAGLLPSSCEIIPQPAGNLGDRINAVDRRARLGGHAHIIYIGSDAPVLDADYYAAAVAALKTHDVVLGPADDGGVTLMGARQAWPELGHLPWSTGDLGAALELTCLNDGLTVYSLDHRYDVDLAADLSKLLDDLRMDLRPARPKTLRVVGPLTSVIQIRNECQLNNQYRDPRAQ